MLIQLNNIDEDDISDLIVKIQKSFAIKLDNNTLSQVQNFGQLCDSIIDEVQLSAANDCTTQQAFYKLRSALKDTLKQANLAITPSTLLEDILPLRHRISTVKKIEHNLSIKLGLLQGSALINKLLAMLTITSIVTFFINIQLGFITLFVSILGFWLAGIFGKKLTLLTVGELSQKIARENL